MVFAVGFVREYAVGHAAVHVDRMARHGTHLCLIPPWTDTEPQKTIYLFSCGIHRSNLSEAHFNSEQLNTGKIVSAPIFSASHSHIAIVRHDGKKKNEC
jgi:hypothetical protein